MSRYRVVGAEAECEKGSNGLVLRNRLGITDPDEMARVEQGLLRQLYQTVLSDPVGWGTSRAGQEPNAPSTSAKMALPSQMQPLFLLTPCKPSSMDQLLNALSSTHVELSDGGSS